MGYLSELWHLFGENLGWHQICPIATCNWKKTTKVHRTAKINNLFTYLIPFFIHFITSVFSLKCEACGRRGAVKFSGWTHTDIVNSQPENGVEHGDEDLLGGRNQVTFVHPMVAESVRFCY